MDVPSVPWWAPPQHLAPAVSRDSPQWQAATKDEQDNLGKIQNVRGYMHHGIGVKKVNDQLTDQLVITVFVDKKLIGDLQPHELVPPRYGNTETEVYIQTPKERYTESIVQL